MERMGRGSVGRGIGRSMDGGELETWVEEKVWVWKEEGEVGAGASVGVSMGGGTGGGIGRNMNGGMVGVTGLGMVGGMEGEMDVGMGRGRDLGMSACMGRGMVGVGIG